VEEDRAYPMTLSMIRRAAGLTQVALAESLKMSQSAVARTEQRPGAHYC
jgi:transcriptional regulator with XRE-family HTH domain